MINRLIIDIDDPEDKRHVSRAVKHTLNSSNNFSKDLINVCEFVIFRLKRNGSNIL